MKTTHVLLAAGIAAAASLTATAPGAMAQNSGKMEKCYGIVKSGLNDCANLAGTHSCAGLAKKDADPNEWLLLPEGACKKIIGGMIEDDVKQQ